MANMGSIRHYTSNSLKMLINHILYYYTHTYSVYGGILIAHIKNFPQGGSTKPRWWDKHQLKAQSLYFNPFLVLISQIDRTTVQAGEREGWFNNSETALNHMNHKLRPTYHSIYKHAHSQEYVSQIGAKAVMAKMSSIWHCTPNSLKMLINHTLNYYTHTCSVYSTILTAHIINFHQWGSTKPCRWSERQLKAQSLDFNPVLVLLLWID